MKQQISRELDRLDLLLEQIKTVAAERDILLVSAAENTGESVVDLEGYWTGLRERALARRTVPPF
jgi:hypothetical protein